MTLNEFTNTVDGMINDFILGDSDEKEFRATILDLLIKVCKDHLGEK